MKKVLAGFLSLIFVFCLFGCGGKEKTPENLNTKEVNTVDIASFVQKGVLSFSEVALSMDINTAINQFHTEADMEDGTRVVLGEYVYGNYKGLKAREINNEVYDISNYTNTTFIYDLNNEQNGIIAISCTTDVYGFQNGITMSEDVINALGEGERYQANSNELYFLPVRPQAEAIKYTYGNNQITFYFVGDFLSATVISVKDVYNPAETEEAAN